MQLVLRLRGVVVSNGFETLGHTGVRAAWRCKSSGCEMVTLGHGTHAAMLVTPYVVCMKHHEARTGMVWQGQTRVCTNACVCMHV